MHSAESKVLLLPLSPLNTTALLYDSGCLLIATPHHATPTIIMLTLCCAVLFSRKSGSNGLGVLCKTLLVLHAGSSCFQRRYKSRCLAAQPHRAKHNAEQVNVKPFNYLRI